MISSAYYAWTGWPTLAKWTSGIAAVVLIEAVSVASGERHFLPALVEHSAALVLRYGLMALMFGGGAWIGIQVAKRSKTWMGWVAGIGFAFVVGGFAMGAAESIPGIGWRMAAMGSDDCHTEWDGRSNPTVCD